MEKMQVKAKAPAIMTLKEAAVELVVRCAELERENPMNAAYMAGYIARYIETTDKKSA